VINGGPAIKERCDNAIKTIQSVIEVFIFALSSRIFYDDKLHGESSLGPAFIEGCVDVGLRECDKNFKAKSIKEIFRVFS
jgi:hypothetical protein